MNKGLVIGLVTLGCIFGGVFCAMGQGAMGRADAGSPAAGLPAAAIFQVTGRVVDSAGAPVSHATVEYLAGGDTVYVVTADNGGFRFSGLTKRSFRVVVSARGYATVDLVFIVAAGDVAAVLPDIKLHNSYQKLDPVTVSRARPITITVDTVTYHASAFPVRDGAEVEAILKRLPGVEVDLSGNVIVDGKIINKVMVDGKEYFGGDVLLAIRNLPADVVEKLQVIDDYGDKARLTGVKVGEPEKVLNIVIKPDKQNGFFGHARSGVGTVGKYAEEVFGNSLKGNRQFSFNGNMADNSLTGKNPSYNGALSNSDQWAEKWGGNWTAGVSGNAPLVNSSVTQKNYYPNEQIDQQQTVTTQARNHTIDAEGSFTYRPDKTSLFRINPSINRQTTEMKSINGYSTQEQDASFSKTFYGQTVNQSTTTTNMEGVDLYFEKELPIIKRRFSIHSIIGWNDSRGLMNQEMNGTVSADSLVSPAGLQYKQVNNTNGLNLGLAADYFRPLGVYGFLELGYTTQINVSRIDRLTESPDSLTGIMAVVDSLSALQDYRIMTQQLHTGYSARFRNLDVSVAVDGQPALQSIRSDSKSDSYTYRYFSFLPQLLANWRVGVRQTVSLQYHGVSTPPVLSQVSPVTDLTNPQYPVTGNPALHPYYTHGVTLHYENKKLQATRFSGFGVSVGYSFAHGTIVPEVIHPKDSTAIIQATTFVNAGSNSSFHAEYHFTFPSFLGNRIRIAAKGNLSRNQDLILTDGESYINRSFIWNQAVHLQVLVPEVVELDMEGSYSLAHTSYSSPSELPSEIQSANASLGGRHYIFRNWVFRYMLTQPYISAGKNMRPAPASLMAIFQRDFLQQNRASISFAGYNLLNTKGATGQTVTPTGITQTQTTYTGRYFLLTFAFKLQRFKKE